MQWFRAASQRYLDDASAAGWLAAAAVVALLVAAPILSLIMIAAQDAYARLDFEYPVKAGAPVDSIIAGLGQLVPDTTLLTEIARNRRKASLLVDKVGFDN